MNADGENQCGRRRQNLEEIRQLTRDGSELGRERHIVTCQQQPTSVHSCGAYGTFACRWYCELVGCRPVGEPDYYEILGVDRNATDAEISAAYRRASNAAHPDRGGASGHFRFLTE